MTSFGIVVLTLATATFLLVNLHVIGISYRCENNQVLVVQAFGNDTIRMHCQRLQLCGNLNLKCNYDKEQQSCGGKNNFVAHVYQMFQASSVLHTCCELIRKGQKVGSIVAGVPGHDGNDCFMYELPDGTPPTNGTGERRIRRRKANSNEYTVLQRADEIPAQLKNVNDNPGYGYRMRLYLLKNKSPPTLVVKGIERVLDGYRVTICRPRCGKFNREAEVEKTETVDKLDEWAAASWSSWSSSTWSSWSTTSWAKNKTEVGDVNEKLRSERTRTREGQITAKVSAEATPSTSTEGGNQRTNYGVLPVPIHITNNNIINVTAHGGSGGTGGQGKGDTNIGGPNNVVISVAGPGNGGGDNSNLTESNWSEPTERPKNFGDGDLEGNKLDEKTASNESGEMPREGQWKGVKKGGRRKGKRPSGKKISSNNQGNGAKEEGRTTEEEDPSREEKKRIESDESEKHSKKRRKGGNVNRRRPLTREKSSGEKEGNGDESGEAKEKEDKEKKNDKKERKSKIGRNSNGIKEPEERKRDSEEKSTPKKEERGDGGKRGKGKKRPRGDETKARVINIESLPQKKGDKGSRRQKSSELRGSVESGVKSGVEVEPGNKNSNKSHGLTSGSGPGTTTFSPETESSETTEGSGRPDHGNSGNITYINEIKSNENGGGSDFGKKGNTKSNSKRRGDGGERSNESSVENETNNGSGVDGSTSVAGKTRKSESAESENGSPMTGKNEKKKKPSKAESSEKAGNVPKKNRQKKVGGKGGNDSNEELKMDGGEEKGVDESAEKNRLTMKGFGSGIRNDSKEPHQPDVSGDGNTKSMEGTDFNEKLNGIRNGTVNGTSLTELSREAKGKFSAENGTTKEGQNKAKSPKKKKPKDQSKGSTDDEDGIVEVDKDGGDSSQHKSDEEDRVYKKKGKDSKGGKKSTTGLNSVEEGLDRNETNPIRRIKTITDGGSPNGSGKDGEIPDERETKSRGNSTRSAESKRENSGLNGLVNGSTKAHEVIVTTTANATFETENATFETENATFETANATFETENATFETENATFETANATFETANTTFETVNTTFEMANTTFETASATFETNIGANGTKFGTGTNRKGKTGSDGTSSTAIGDEGEDGDLARIDTETTTRKSIGSGEEEGTTVTGTEANRGDKRGSSAGSTNIQKIGDTTPPAPSAINNNNIGGQPIPASAEIAVARQPPPALVASDQRPAAVASAAPAQSETAAQPALVQEPAPTTPAPAAPALASGTGIGRSQGAARAAAGTRLFQQPDAGAGAQPSALRRSCFSADTLVKTVEGHKRMDELEVGDMVLVPAGGNLLKYERVEMFYHREPETYVKFALIETESGKALSLTPLHLLPFGECEEMWDSDLSIDGVQRWLRRSRFAYKARIDQCLLTVDMDTGTLAVDRIVKVGRRFSRGIYSPVTVEGALVTNGVLASCFSQVESHSTQKLAFDMLMLVYNMFGFMTSHMAESTVQEVPALLSYIHHFSGHILPFAKY